MTARTAPAPREKQRPAQAVPDRQGDAAAASRREGDVPPVVLEALRSPGERLDAASLDSLRRRHDFSDAGVILPRNTRADRLVVGRQADREESAARAAALESRTAGNAFPDFTRVRIHSDAVAARAAAALNADAFTLGSDVVFGAGRFTPSSRAGRSLLAHELAHVVQHSHGAAQGVIRCRSIFESAAIFLGLSEGDFAEGELLDYLKKVDKANAIEDSYDSDNKARAIVRRWKAGQAKFRLSAHQMVLLIREMDTGYVGSEDQTEILDLLSHAANGDLRVIFAPGAISPKGLESDFSGDRRKALLRFYESRFRGGKTALYAGTVDPSGGPVAGTPQFAWSLPAFVERIDEPLYTDDELAAEVTALPDAQRDTALTQIGQRRNLLEKAVIELGDKAAAETDAGKKASLESALGDLKRRRQRYDAILQPAFRDVALGETPATLLPKTHLPTAAEKSEIGKALKPDLQTGAGGAALPFKDQLAPGEKKYGDKVKDYMPDMVKSYFDMMVVGKGPAEHADPAKVHKLDEFDSIANAAKDEADAVYGPYLTGSHPAFRSDRAPPVGRGQLHDLFADTQKQLAAMGPGAKRLMAKRLVKYFFQNDDGIAALNRAHNADPHFGADEKPVNTEAKKLEAVADGWVSTAAHVKALNEIDRNWDASADPSTHEVNLQIFKKGTPDEDRSFLWDMLQTLIHEYLHTLANPAYVTFAEQFGPGQENTTLIEGTDSFLTEIVWSKTKSKTSDAALRAKVEGAAYSGLPFDASVIPPIYNRRYASYAQAVKLVNAVGIRNLYAAYFMGKVELIKPT